MTKKTTIAIIHAPYYQHIDRMLVDSACQELSKQHIDYDIISVSGALEIPIALHMVINHQQFHGAILCGCVIRGETSHYDYVCQESIAGITRLAIDYQFPIGNAILTVENEQQAVTRADPKQKNKAADAVTACINLLQIQQQYPSALSPDMLQS